MVGTHAVEETEVVIKLDTGISALSAFGILGSKTRS